MSAGVGVGLQALDRRSDVGISDQIALRPPDQHDVGVDLVQGGAGRLDARDGVLEVVQRTSLAVLDRQPADAGFGGHGDVGSDAGGVVREPGFEVGLTGRSVPAHRVRMF
jgi:hypothetical protein